ncbi:MAG: ATP-dependent zinc metalloprotease FtsH [Saprospiraceae bacterium]|nr:ATP-dependent zinc metalloprotease FtsH [Saprospiraceae bacterium]
MNIAGENIALPPLTHFLDHVETLVRQRCNEYFSQNGATEAAGQPSAMGEQANFHISLPTAPGVAFNWFEYSLLGIALAAHIQPQFFDEIIHKNLPKAGDFPQIGGVRGKNFRGFLPTGETALFLLAGSDLEKRLIVQQFFGTEHFFYKKHILWLEDAPPGEPRMSGKIILSPEFVEWFTTGKVTPPAFSTEFPARLIETELSWEDLVLQPDVLAQIRELETWVKHNAVMLRDWKMHKRIKPGYRVLFHGPPGTGKTLTASLLGKYTGKDVYRIDLSTVVSKYIGETEKNLASLFDRAEDKDWILFFDEADALFGKRTNVRDAHDKYANQEVSYLLQRVEDFNGLVILASNMKSNIDDAFMRRFNAIIKFPMPDERERESIWRISFPDAVTFESNGNGKPMDLPRVAARYELSGGNIINVVHFACLRAAAKKSSMVTWESVKMGIQREFAKEGRVFKDLG